MLNVYFTLQNETVIEPPTGINLPNNNEDITYIADNRLFPNIYLSGRDSHYSVFINIIKEIKKKYLNRGRINVGFLLISNPISIQELI